MLSTPTRCFCVSHFVHWPAPALTPTPMAIQATDPRNTIAAIATASGVGAIAVVRISGPQAIVISEKGFRPPDVLGSSTSHTAHVGQFVDGSGVVIDEVVATVFRSPRSYTGEDVVELSCHGSSLIAHRILDTLVAFGARIAQPGEFTKRAFLNGKIDLAQAEAVAELIGARSEMARRASLDQLSGSMSKRIHALRDSLVSLVSLLELELDFVEEGIELVEVKTAEDQIADTISTIDGLIRSYSAGKYVREGVRVVLAGSPNVGKSSILNALLDEDRAIVTDVPGTTRDVIEESISIDGLHFVLSDTAGVRSTVDIVERHGVDRAEMKIRNSDILLLVVDGSQEIGEHEVESIDKLLREVKNASSECIVVLNKADLGESKTKSPRFRHILETFSNLRISAKTGSGLDSLRKALTRAAHKGGLESSESGLLVTSLRHKDALVEAKTSLERALKSASSSESSEFIVIDLRAALDKLGEIIGLTTTDDILNSIFSKFCIGK